METENREEIWSGERRRKEDLATIYSPPDAGDTLVVGEKFFEIRI